MKKILLITFLVACHSSDAASTQLFQNIQAGQSISVTFTLAVPPPSPYNLLSITAGGSGIRGIDSFTAEIYDGATLLGSETSGDFSPPSLRSASNPFTSFVGRPSLLADLSTLNDDGTLLGRILITPNFSPSGGNISRYAISINMINQTNGSGGTFFGQSVIAITSAQVIPEPDSLILAGASLCLLLKRSRQSQTSKASAC